MFYQLLQPVAPGTPLLPVVKQVCQDKMERFGEATGNSGIIHLDYKYCEKAYDHHKTFVYGYMLLAFISEMMENNFGLPWLESGVMDLKFIGPAHPGQEFIARGIVTEVNEQENGQDVVCSCEVVNQEGGKPAMGTVRLYLPNACGGQCN